MYCLRETVELLKTEGEANTGTTDALLAYQVLSRLAANANAYGVPLADIGLAGYDIEGLLRTPFTA
ncbi:hypothetical protein CCZ27_09555 [Thauera sinica]|nr:hypothetical protein CCZ27_09555 [Thauera sp. K11]